MLRVEYIYKYKSDTYKVTANVRERENDNFSAHVIGFDSVGKSKHLIQVVNSWDSICDELEKLAIEKALHSKVDATPRC